VGFGGGLSVLASIRTAVVTRKQWLTEKEFGNTIIVSQMLPGGAAANALAYIGLRFGGIRGAFLGYVGFVLPGFVAVMVLAFAYVNYGASPDIETLLGGFNAAVVGIIGAITLKMAQTAVTRLWQMGLAAMALLFSAVGDAAPGEVVLLSICIGLAVDLGTKRVRHHAIFERRRDPRPGEDQPVVLPEEAATLSTSRPPPPSPPEVSRPPAPETPKPPVKLHSAFLTLLLAAGALHITHIDRDLVQLFLSFFRTGLGAYGGGFAIIPHLKSVVARQGWLTDRQFADAVAIGKLTPGSRPSSVTCAPAGWERWSRRWPSSALLSHWLRLQVPGWIGCARGGRCARRCVD
jgi:chromate transporter